MAKRVIVEVDVGTDDYLALLMLFKAEELKQIEIVALLCAAGNTTLENVVKNVVRLLETVGRTDIPVYKGVEGHLLNLYEVQPYHGLDGMADLTYKTEPNLTILQEPISPLALNDLIRNNAGIIFIELAPLTNLALTFKLHPDLSTFISELWIMGGNYMGVGNVTKYAEFNFYTDPEAAHIVLQHAARCSTFLVPWEACEKSKITRKWRFDVLGAIPNPAMELLNKADQIVMSQDPSLYFQPCDGFAVFCMLNPQENIKKFCRGNVDVVLHGEKRGKVNFEENCAGNIQIVQDINEDSFVKFLSSL